MIKSKNELIAYMDGYGDACSDFIDALNTHGNGIPVKCMHEMQRKIKMLNKAICKFNSAKPIESEDKE